MTPRRNDRGAEPHPTFSPRPPSRFALRRIRAKRLTVAIALLFALSLTACDTTRSEPRKRHITVGITAVGGPLDATGSRHPQTVLLEVRDENDDLVNFDAELVADRRGSVTVITLPPDKPSVTIQLPIGKAYVLVARGYDTSENQLTFGETTVTAGAAPTAVIVQLHTLLGSGRLVPRLPINHLVPGQTLDLIHIVSPNGRTDLHVPEHELDVTYDGNVEVINRCETASGGSKEAQGEAFPQQAGSTDKLWVRFDNWFSKLFPGLTKGHYWVLYLDSEYSVALVGSPDRDYLWLLSRDEQIDIATRDHLLDEAHKRGYDTADLIWRGEES